VSIADGLGHCDRRGYEEEESHSQVPLDPSSDRQQVHPDAHHAERADEREVYEELPGGSVFGEIWCFHVDIIGGDMALGMGQKSPFCGGIQIFISILVNLLTLSNIHITMNHPTH